jgi:hypothetical protein
MTLREFADRIGVSDRVVSRWEAGGAGITPRPVNQQALDTMLDMCDAAVQQRFAVATRGTLEGAVNPDPVAVDDVERRAFLRVAVGVAAGTVAARHLGDGDASDILNAVAAPTMHYRQMEQVVPTEHLTAAVDGHRELATHLVGGVLPTTAGYAALSEVTGLAAWLAVDQGHAAAARKHYLAAIGYAERAGHALLATYMRASLGQYATESGDVQQGLVLLRQARAELDESAPDAARAWLAGLHAVACAKTNDARRARTELRVSEKLAARQGGEPAWPWIFAYDGTKAARHEASALAALGDLAGTDAAYAVAFPATSAPKARALIQVEHAQALADAGHVGEGCELAVAALAVGQQYGSERIVQRVRALRASLPASTGAAAGLDEQLAGLYTAQS